MGVLAAPNFEQRLISCWQGPTNHNWMRISRALQSLDLAALQEEKRALLIFLMNLVQRCPDLIDAQSVATWKLRGGVGGELDEKVANSSDPMETSMDFEIPFEVDIEFEEPGAHAM